MEGKWLLCMLLVLGTALVQAHDGHDDDVIDIEDDLDDVIEERAGRRIPEIFASEGEAEFRRMEAEALEACIEKKAARDDAPLAPSHSRAAGPSPYAGVRKCRFHPSVSSE